MGHTDVSLSRVILVSVPLMPLQCAAQCFLQQPPLLKSPHCNYFVTRVIFLQTQTTPPPPLHPPVLCAREKATCDICSRCDL